MRTLHPSLRARALTRAPPPRSVLALLTLGEGWHNNHHRFMASARHGFVQPYEIDVTFYAIKGARARSRRACHRPALLTDCSRRAVMERVGLAWNLKRAPAELLAEARRR